jgi:hypothetical protein
LLKDQNELLLFENERASDERRFVVLALTDAEKLQQELQLKLVIQERELGNQRKDTVLLESAINKLKGERGEVSSEIDGLQKEVRNLSKDKEKSKILR